MHLSSAKFQMINGSLTAYCGDLNPPQPTWSLLRPGVADSEVGIFLYFLYEHEENPHIIRYVLNDAVYSHNGGSIEKWYLYMYHADKKDFRNGPQTKMVILNEFNPENLVN